MGWRSNESYEHEVTTWHARFGYPSFTKGEELGRQRLDMVVDEKLINEIKSTHELHKDAKRQVYNYLKATRLEVGLLLHFGPQADFDRMDFRHASLARAASKNQGPKDKGNSRDKN